MKLLTLDNPNQVFQYQLLNQHGFASIPCLTLTRTVTIDETNKPIRFQHISNDYGVCFTFLTEKFFASMDQNDLRELFKWFNHIKHSSEMMIKLHLTSTMIGGNSTNQHYIDSDLKVTYQQIYEMKVKDLSLTAIKFGEAYKEVVQRFFSVDKPDHGVPDETHPPTQVTVLDGVNLDILPNIKFPTYSGLRV